MNTLEVCGQIGRVAGFKPAGYTRIGHHPIGRAQ
jgi:hypothetical protein